MKSKLEKEKELWDKIQTQRNEMVRIATIKNFDFLDQEVLSLSQELNRLLIEYEKLLHQK